jgi:PAS domain S-box-containing protein
MATRVVTFRLPEDLIQAISSQAKERGTDRTAVVIDALKQVFGFPSSQTSPASLKGLQRQQDAVREEMVCLNKQPVEFRQGASSYSNPQHVEELNQTLAARPALIDEVSLPLQKTSQSQDIRGVSDLTDTSEGVSFESKPMSGQSSDFEEALQQLAEKVEQRARMLEQVLSASVDHICMYDRLGRYTYANRAFLQSFELERPELYGKTWQQVGLPADIMKPFDAKLQITLATGQSIAEEISLPTVSGVREYEYILNPIHSGDGSIEAVVYTARDITERKHAEESLRESEKNYRNLFEWAHDSIFITDSSNHSLLDVNEHAARRLGYTRKQLLHLPTEVYSPPMDLKDREAVLQRLWQTGSVTFEHVHKCKNGRQMPVEISSRVVEYGGRLAIQNFVRDITERKQAEQKLALYQQIITNFSEAIAIIDLKGYYIEQNPAHALLLGYSNDELRGLTSGYLLGKETSTVINQELTSNGSYRGEVTSRTKSGDLLNLKLATFVICNDTGEPVCYVESKRHIGDYKQSKEESL